MADRPQERSSVQDFVRNVRNAVTNLQSQTEGPNEERSRAAFAFNSISEEINSRFQIPRQANRGRSIATTTVPASTFNPRRNYSSPVQSNGRLPARGGVRNARVSGQQDFMYKDVCLLPGPECDQVPRGAEKATLVQLGLYVDAFKLDKTWGEARLYSELVTLFKEALGRSSLGDIG